MNDDELDRIASLGNDPADIEHEYTDEELLSTRPESNFVKFKKPEQESLVKSYLKDVAMHPLATAEGIGEVLLPVMNPIGWIPAAAEAITAARNYTKGTALDKYLPEMGSPYGFLRHMDEKPGDWVHLIGGKLQDMTANPEDYAE